MKKLIIIFVLVFSMPSTGFSDERTIELGLAAMNKDGGLPSGDQIAEFEAKVGRPINAVGWFIGFNGDKQELPALPLAKLVDNIPDRIVPMLTLEPWGDIKDGEGNPKSPLDVINNGSLDPYFRQMARDIKTYNRKIRIRFAHEMIQNDVPESIDPHPGWYPWQDYPAQYINAFRRFVTIFREEKVSNVEFVWAPNYHMHDFSILAKYYPGQEYVDWIGLDGYNWGGEDFDGIFKNIYQSIVLHPEIFGDKPVMISEFAMAQVLDKTRTKAQWIKDAFAKIRSEQYGKIRALYWFEVNKEHDWRLQSSDNSWNAFKAAIQ